MSGSVSDQVARARRRRGMVRLVVSVVAMGAALVGFSGRAEAGEEVPVSGTFTAEGSFTFQCAFAQEFLTGSGDWSGLGAVTLDFEFCVDNPATITDPWPVTRGSFTITAESGTLTGDIGGHVMAGSPNPEGLFPGQLTFTVTGATGELEGATGTLVLDILSEYVPMVDRRMTGTVSGTLSFPLPTPTTTADCRDGGWEHLGDENGEPFGNQGQCVRWVLHHR